MDDATSEIYSAFFVAEEGTMSTFRAFSEVISARPVLRAVCRPWISLLAHAHAGASGRTTRRRSPALDQLGSAIPAFRRSRALGAHVRHAAGRLPRTLAGITAWTRQSLSPDDYLPAQRSLPRPGRPAPRSAFARHLEDILCVQEAQSVRQHRPYRAGCNPPRHRHHYVKHVRVHNTHAPAVSTPRRLPLLTSALPHPPPPPPKERSSRVEQAAGSVYPVVCQPE